MHIGHAIRCAHAVKNIKHIRVAQQIGVSAANYSHSLTQKGMQVKRYKEICDALGMTMDQVFKIGEEYVDGNSNYPTGARAPRERPRNLLREGWYGKGVSILHLLRPRSDREAKV